MGNKELANFQSLLLETLVEGGSSEQMLQRLKSAPEIAAFRDYLEQVDTDMLETASLIVRKWAQRDESGGTE